MKDIIYPPELLRWFPAQAQQYGLVFSESVHNWPRYSQRILLPGRNGDPVLCRNLSIIIPGYSYENICQSCEPNSDAFLVHHHSVQGGQGRLGSFQDRIDSRF